MVGLGHFLYFFVSKTQIFKRFSLVIAVLINIVLIMTLDSKCLEYEDNDGEQVCVSQEYLMDLSVFHELPDNIRILGIIQIVLTFILLLDYFVNRSILRALVRYDEC